MPSAIRIDGLLAVKRATILQVFTREVLIRGFPTPQATPAEIARPADACLTALVRALGPSAPEENQLAALAADYAKQRIRLGYDLRSVLTEFGLLRSAVLDAIAGITTSPDTVHRVVDFLHEVMVEVALRFAERTNRARPFSPAA